MQAFSAFTGIIYCLFTSGCAVNHSADLKNAELSEAPVCQGEPDIPVNYHVYYGSLHNHTGLMGGLGTQQEAYQYARKTAKLDFLGIAEHDYGFDSVSWKALKTTANANNDDGAFVAFWGFEWSSGVYGHVAVIQSRDFCSSADSAPTATFTGLCNWLMGQHCAAFLNHPGYENAVGKEFGHFAAMPPEGIVGMELWNKNTPFASFFYSEGYDSGDSHKGYFGEALSRGWKIGAAGSHDNHEATWGTSNDYRLAILADTLTRDSLFAALITRRFYSTLDKNLRLSFTICGKQMGSTVGAGKRVFEIRAADDNGETFVEASLFGASPSHERHWTLDGTIVAVSDTLEARDGDYFFVKITQSDGGEAISSPIWVADGPRLAP
jgi:hypothetical protein